MHRFEVAIVTPGQHRRTLPYIQPGREACIRIARDLVHTSLCVDVFDSDRRFRSSIRARGSGLLHPGFWNSSVASK